MVRLLTFEKDPDGSWYVVLPEWEGERADLQMVAGADKMCEILAQGEDLVNLHIGDEPFDSADKLTLIVEGEDEGGGYYFVEMLKQVRYNMQIWLCDVTKFVFKTLPKTIYIR